MHDQSHQSCLALCNLMDGSLPGSSFHGVCQARILEWVAISFSKGSSWLRDLTHISCIVGRFFTAESPGKPFAWREGVIVKRANGFILESGKKMFSPFSIHSKFYFFCLVWLYQICMLSQTSSLLRSSSFPGLSLKILMNYVCAQSCLTFCNPMDYSLPGSSVH